MLVSTQNRILSKRFGPYRAAEIIMDSGFSAIDFTLSPPAAIPFVFEDDYKQTAKKLKEQAAARGVVYNQAHSPHGGGFENYTTKLVPTFPRIFEFAALLGVKTIVVHPIQDGRFYGREQELFERSLEFYTSLAPLAKNNGIKIGIENMWRYHPVTGRIEDDTLANPLELAKMYDELSDPEAFTVCLDIGHVTLCGREPECAIRQIGGERIGALHVHDTDYINDCHTIPGLQKINWENVVSALAEINYKGDFTLEADYFLRGFPDELLPAASRLMGSVANYYAGRIEALKKDFHKI